MAGLWVIAFSTFLLHYVTAVSKGCPPLPISHFQWLNPDGTLVRPQASCDGGIHCQNEVNDCCGPKDSDAWKPLPDNPSCQFCSSKAILVCQGSDVYDVPDPASLPSARISLYKMSGVGLISLLPKSFMGLSIQKLVIENSSISYLAIETFSGVKSIKSLCLKNNMLDYIPQADYLFSNIKDLTFLSLEESRLKVLSSAGTANMYNLTYFSLAGNPLYTMDVFFLQNSGLTFLDMRNITFKIKNIEGTGLCKLPSSLNTIDLSRAIITSGAFGKLMEQLKEKNIKTLNLSYLQLQFRSFWALRHINNSLQHLSLKGTDLFLIFHSKRTEINIPNYVQFVNMKELNLENCNISYFGSQETLKAFPNLTILSLAGNQFFSLDLSFFLYLPKLVFIDLSNNQITDVFHNVEQEVKNLQGMDLSTSYFGLNARDSAIFFHTLQHLQMVSFCKTPMSEEVAKALQYLHNLRYLDLSAAISFPEHVRIVNDLFSNINISLTELHFTQTNFKPTSDYPSFFSQLTSLETLDISNNLIRELSGEMFAPSLKTLNASRNLITTWYVPVMNNESQLQCLDLSNNQITYITDTMVKDFYKLDSLSLDSNPLICHNKIVALICSDIKNNTQNNNNETIGIENSNQSTQIYAKITKNNSKPLTHVDWKHYRCYDLLLNGFRQFSQEKDCNEYYEEVSSTHNPENPTTQYDNQETTTTIQQPVKKFAGNWEWTFILVGPIVLFSGLGGIVYLKWWNIKCFVHRYISLKKAHLLRKNGNLLARPEVYYDVFVSYSDVDRAWVLDHLVPNIEGDRDVSLCFHERDFQVGMTILENIIDCMDHSHALLLVVSSAFIYSKWCQFEMHLAQYRLIETFRDKLVLVLLEDIPRKTRPQTLHHLMMSKTYLMWPQQPCKDDAYELFWRRLKRALRPNPNYTVPV